MPSPGRAATAARLDLRPRRQRRYGPGPELRIVAAIAALGLSFAIGGILVSDALAASGCAPSQATSPDGTIVYGSACADEIVVTSPLVKKVFAGDGNDVIYANPDVEEVYGGEGADVLFGDLPDGEAVIGGGPEREVEPEVEPESETGIDYETAPESEASASGLRGLLRSDPLATVSNKVECTTESPCYGGDGSQEMFGGPGADQIFGQRGNDTLHGEAGSDRLYGGIGDDTIFGNDGYDLLSGGLGTDTLDGNNGSDTVRGDGTVDVLKDTGGDRYTDTLSFATAVTPGFRGAVPVPGFPPEGDEGERGVYIRMDGAPAPCGTQSCNNDARYGGGGDEIDASDFETVIGSPFDDYYVGSDGRDRFFGGGGSDVMIGNGGYDVFFGGNDGDFMSGGAGGDISFSGAGFNNCSHDVEYGNQCTGRSEEVRPRDPSKIEVGYQAGTTLRDSFTWEPFYLLGSQSTDRVSVKFGHASVAGYPEPLEQVTFTAEPGSAEFETGGNVWHGQCNYQATEVKCTLRSANRKLYEHLDALVLAGMAGDDTLSIAGNETEWPVTTTPVLLGGQGNDVLIGSGHTEDVLVDGDGPGNDTLYGFGFDDALLNNEGADNLQAGAGSDLLLSATTCDGDILQGAEGKTGDKEDVNNASWSQLPAYAGGVVADLRSKTAGGQYTEAAASAAASASVSASASAMEGEASAAEGKASGGRKGKEVAKAEVAKGGGGQGGGGGAKGGRPSGGPSCTTGSVDRLYNIDDLEGSAQPDAFYGDAASNNLLGRSGEDLLFGRGGEDRIAAKDGEHDQVGGGAGKDVCIYDEGLDTLTSCNP